MPHTYRRSEKVSLVIAVAGLVTFLLVAMSVAPTAGSSRQGTQNRQGLPELEVRPLALDSGVSRQAPEPHGETLHTDW